MIYPVRLRRDEDEPVEVFRGTRFDKWIFNAIGPAYSLLFIAFVFNPGKGGNALRVGVAASIVAALALSWRGRRLGTIEAGQNGVTAYGAVFRWRWLWAEVDHFDVGSGPLPFAPVTDNKPLMVYLRDGQVRRLTSINGKSRVRGQPSWIELAVQRLNDLLRSHDGGATTP